MKNNRKFLIALLITALAIPILAGCDNKKAEIDDEKSLNSAETEAGGGLTWSIPAAWATGAEKPMRLATYLINPVNGDSDSGECAVFYFGPTSGGGVEENLQRWAGQFEQPDGSISMEKAIIDSFSVNSINITAIDLKGTYLVSGTMMQITGKKEGYRLLGAIVEGPEGSVFFKLTGPQKTMESAEAGFDALLKSIKPGLT